MADIQHSAITGSDAVHPNDYYQSADPGAVGPGKSWKDTTNSPPVQNRRNVTDTGWDLILDPSTFTLKSTLTALGDMYYASAASTPARVAPNTTATKKFLRMTGTGTVGAAPAWDTLVAGDIPSLAASIITSGTFSTAQIPSLDTSKITTGVFGVGRIPAVDMGYYGAHVNGGASLDIWYLLSASTATVPATGATVANTLYAVPFVAPARGATLDRLAFSVTGALAGNARVGIYDTTSDTNLYPNNLIVDGGGISTGTTGAKAATISQALTGGKLYWAVYLGDAAPTIRLYAAGGQNAILGCDSSLGSYVRGLSVALTYGALPATFTAGATIVTSAIIPCVFARYSA